MKAIAVVKCHSSLLKVENSDNWNRLGRIKDLPLKPREALSISCQQQQQQNQIQRFKFLQKMFSEVWVPSMVIVQKSLNDFTNFPYSPVLYSCLKPLTLKILSHMSQSREETVSCNNFSIWLNMKLSFIS